MNFKAEVVIIHILPNGHFDFGGKIAGHYIFWFLPAHDDLDKSSQGILETANSQTTLIKILSSEKTNFSILKMCFTGDLEILMNRKLFISNEAGVETSSEIVCMPGRLMTFENLYWPRQSVKLIWTYKGPAHLRKVGIRKKI